MKTTEYSGIGKVEMRWADPDLLYVISVCNRMAKRPLIEEGGECLNDTRDQEKRKQDL